LIEGMKLSDMTIDHIASIFRNAELGDPRRSERAARVAEKLARNPQLSIPDAVGTAAELEGAYRLMNNERVTMEALHASHAKETAARAREHGVVLAISDTTPCGFAHADPQDVGYLSTGKAGFYLHYTLVVTPHELRPLGVSYVEPVFRDKAPSKPRKSGRPKKKQSAFELRKKANRESDRWQRGLVMSDEVLSGCEVIHVADRESDSYELMANAIEAGRRFVFRVRAPQRKGRLEEGADGSVGDLAAAQEGVLQREVPLSSRQPRMQTTRAQKDHPPRNARLATLQFSATRLELIRPRYLPAGEFEKTIPIHVVRVWEPDPPEGDKPVEWLLYTTEPVGTPEEITAVVDIYRARWLIEECNKALKTGCLIEHRQFESREALLKIIALSLPIACELLALRAAARRTPDRPATDVMTPQRIEVLRRLGHRPLPENPTIYEALWAVAGMGGHQKSNGDPGWRVLQRGMRKLLDYEIGYTAGLRDAAAAARWEADL
jgi:hypothetical protein